MAVLISVTEGDVTQIVLADVGVQGATGPSSPASGIPFTPYGNIAATNVQTAIQELDDEKFGKAGGTVTGNLEIGTGGTLSFEGATADGFETTLAVVDPTADRTLTLPNVTGTFVTTGDTGTVTSTMLLDGTILNADVNASAAIAGTKISPDFGSQTIVTTGVHSAAAGSAAAPSIAFTGDTDTGIYRPGADQLAISTGATERMRIDSAGRLLVGTSTTGLQNVRSLLWQGNGEAALYINHSTGDGTGDPFVKFGHNGGQIGSITQSGTTAVLYNLTSDQRLKENIQDSDLASTLIDALQVRQFEWKSDKSHQRYGFVAQELVTVAPEAVHQPNNPDEMMGVDYSKLVPMLVKEVQSLRARLAAAGIA